MIVGITNLDSASLCAFTHHQDVGWFLECKYIYMYIYIYNKVSNTTHSAL